MYYNVFGEKVSRRKYKEMLEAAKNRRELIAAGLTSRRDLMKMGLLTAGGMLVAKSGLSARAQSTAPQTQLPGDGQVGSNQNCVPTKQAASPPTRAFIEPLPIMPVAQTVASLSPTPTTSPNTAAGEVRAAPHQATQLDASRFPGHRFLMAAWTRRPIPRSTLSPIPRQRHASPERSSSIA